MQGNTTKIIIILLILCCPLYGDDLFHKMRIIKPKVRMKAPNFTLNSVDGTIKSLKEFKGKVILLNFWATWCTPCRDEIPSMEKMWKKFNKRGFVIIAIAVDKGSRDKVKDFCKKQCVTFPVLLDPKGNVRKTYEIRALPTSYIIDRSGRFIGKIIGSRDWASDTAIDFINSLLE